MDDIWAVLIADAMDHAACGREGAECRINYRANALYASYQHLDDDGHDCGVCNIATLPTRIVSVQTLMMTNRTVLVATLARWLEHLHEHRTNLRAAASERPSSADGRVDATDPSTGAPRASGGAAIAADPSTTDAASC